MRTEIVDSSIEGTVVNPGKVEVDEVNQAKVQDPKNKPDEKKIVPNVSSEMEKDENDEDENNVSQKTFEDINNGLE